MVGKRRPGGYACSVCSVFAVLMGFPALSGCNGSGISGLQPVTGTVTFKGEPVEGAIISFVGDGDTRPAISVSKSDGTYVLYTLDSVGALPGNYKVVVTKTQTPDGADDADPGFSKEGVDLSMEQAAKQAGRPIAKPVELLPTKYASPATTPLAFEVKSGVDVYDVKLE